MASPSARPGQTGYQKLVRAPKNTDAEGPKWTFAWRTTMCLTVIVLAVLAVVGIVYAVSVEDQTDRISRYLGLGGDDDDGGHGPDTDYFSGGAGFSGSKRLVYYTDLAHFNPGSDGVNFYFAAPGFVGNGWNISHDARGVLTLSATPYNVTVQQNVDGPCPECGLDHVKALAYYNQATFLPNDGTEVYFGGRYSCEISGLDNQPFGDAVADLDDDIRLAWCGFNTIALPGVGETAANRMGVWTVADLVLSKGRQLRNGLREFLVYALVEVLPNGNDRFGGSLGDYWCGTHAVPLGRVTSRDGWVDLAISFDRKAGTVRYWVDGKLRYTLNKVGEPIDVKYRVIDHGGVPSVSYPVYVSRGRGIFTLLDAFRPNNLKKTPNQPLVQLDSDLSHYRNVFGPGFPTFLDPQSLISNRLFGQRTTFKIAYESSWTEKGGHRDD